jgi:S-DNA-T family DNA segregation ATPase FtsK/SpoIIIE
MDFAILGVPPDVFSDTSPPGRGFMDDSEVQVAVIGGEASIAKQAAQLARLVGAMERAGVTVAPPIARLPEQVSLSSIPYSVGHSPVLGIHDETLAPISFELAGVFVVAGPPQSGRTTAVATMVASLQRSRPETRFVLFGARRSQLAGAANWVVNVSTPDDIATIAAELAEKINAESPEVANSVVVIENVGDLSGTVAEEPLQDLLKACRTYDLLVIAEGETSTLTGWGLMQAVKASKYGIALQPDDGDGDTLFGTAFPRSKRADFPTGRGFYVKGGRVYRVQMPTPG